MSDNFEDYKEKRRVLLEKEICDRGEKNTLSKKEKLVNEVIVQAKVDELSKSYQKDSEFLPAQNFIKVKEQINLSKVFNLIRGLPKGASLHTHMLAGVNVDFIIENITYRDNLYGGFVNGIFKLRFFEEGAKDDRCEWKKVSEMRKGVDPHDFDKWLKMQFLLNDNIKNSDQAWVSFKKIFNAGYEMFSYRPVFEDIIYQLLKELYEDNTFYTELKGTVMPLYELDGTLYNSVQFFEILLGSIEKFKQDYSDFLGVKYIHSIYRGIDNETLEKELERLLELKQQFPNLIAGLDFVGHEEEGHRLFDFSKLLLEVQADLDFFFHAGETPWYGHTDLNLVDAVLLNSKRIGHGYAITKHPEVYKLARENDIAMEISPISNQMLKLLDDPRSHPAVNFFATGYPVVVCNDDPSIWGATGLSYDWYIAFMAMTSKESGIEILKTIALNSIKYSSMNESEKREAYSKWSTLWDIYLDKIVDESKDLLSESVE